MKSKIIYCVIIIVILTMKILPQASTWPLNKSASDITSPFGVRELPGYDFHEGIDISAKQTNIVYATVDGWVDGRTSTTSTSQNQYIIIETIGDDLYDAYDNETIKYMHLVPNPSLVMDDPVVAGTTILGTILDYKNNGDPDDHLDFRYCEYDEFDNDNTVHPLRALDHNHLDCTIILPNQVLSDIYGHYIDIKVSNEASSLDFRELLITLDGNTALPLPDGENFYNRVQRSNFTHIDFELRQNVEFSGGDGIINDDIS
ncbi:MAG: hypothetical protein JEY94_19080 [Melioribacteraceae bacterium]|nr:hypothetical protein [Melioribacteraceae bacterium]